MKTSILLTGGHLTPALALIEYLQETKSEVDIVFVGRLYSQDRTRQLSQEKVEVEQRGVQFVPLTSPRLSGAVSLLTKLGPFIKSLSQANDILKKYQPSAVVSFGGYLAVPVALMAWLRGIPVVTHEQTRTVGIATQIIGWVARKIAVSFPETLNELPITKAVLVGNPLRSELLQKPTKPSWAPSASLPLLYVTGGNQGSLWLNETIAHLLPKLVEEWIVVHQCGNATTEHNSKEHLETLRSELSRSHQERYIIKEWFSATELAWLYRHAAVIFSRAGANTVQELQHFAVPSLLVPLPNSRRDEQFLNAQHLAELGGAVILDQNTTTTDDVWAALTQLKLHAAEYKTRLEAHPVPTTAAAQLWQVVAGVLSENAS